MRCTGDYEWYDPSAVTTEDGNLVITLSKKDQHDLNYMSGMIQSWNKVSANRFANMNIIHIASSSASHQVMSKFLFPSRAPQQSAVSGPVYG